MTRSSLEGSASCPYPKEFRRDVVAVARRGDQSMAKVAQSFGISASCLARWLRIADREDGNDTPPPTTVDEVEVRELRRRNKQLEQEVDILCRATAYFARDTLPK
jgi:transposase